MKHTEPLTVKPGGTAVVSFILNTYRPGKFHDSFPVYLDDGSLRQIQLSIRGVAVSRPVAAREQLRPDTGVGQGGGAAMSRK